MLQLYTMNRRQLTFVILLNALISLTIAVGVVWVVEQQRPDPERLVALATPALPAFSSPAEEGAEATAAAVTEAAVTAAAVAAAAVGPWWWWWWRRWQQWLVRAGGLIGGE